jgi:hypothetical protein
VDVLRAQAIARCEHGEAVFEGNSEVIGLDVNGEGGEFSEEVRITDPANPLLNIYLNEQTTEEDAGGNRKLTQRTLHIFGLRSIGFLVDIVVAEAIVDVHGDPCGLLRRRSARITRTTTATTTSTTRRPGLRVAS